MPDTAPSPGNDDPLAIHGVVPPTVTAFDEHGDLDLEGTAEHAQFVVDSGATAVLPLGTNGEFPLLTAEERKDVVATVSEAVDVPVLPGIGCPSTRTTISHAEHAEAVGADGVVAVTPYYYPVDEAGMVRHYETLADAVDIPVYVYHIPSKTGNHLSLSTMERLAAIDGIAGVKDSSKDVPWLTQAIDTNSQLTFLAGSDSLLFAGLEIGCAGLVSAVANVFPELVVDLYDAYNRGREFEAKELQSKIFQVRSALKAGPYLSGVKTALSLRKTPFEVGELRPPLRMMSDDERETLESALVELDLL